MDEKHIESTSLFRTTVLPARFVMIIAIVVFTAEALVMFILHIRPGSWSISNAHLVEGLLDAALLAFITLPALYFFMFRPMRSMAQKQASTDNAIQAITQRVIRDTGEKYLRSLSKNMSIVLDMDCILIARIDDMEEGQAHTIAVYGDGRFMDNFSYVLKGTPCDNVAGKSECVYPHGIQQMFPEDTMLVDMGMDGYVGAPLFDYGHDPIGIIAGLSKVPIEDSERVVKVFKLYALRAVTELERMSADQRLEQTILERTIALSQTNVALAKEVLVREKAESRLSELLQEREILIREVHHRTKNNLAMVQSLLSLHSRRHSDPEIQDALTESGNRIKAFSMVHESLYSADNLKDIDLSKYLKGLSEQIIESFATPARDVRLLTDIDKVSFHIDDVVPCGLIMNELISNAMKHAFPEQGQGEIYVKLKAHGDDRFMLSVKDNGKGMPEGLDMANLDTLGFQIINALVSQINGELEIVRGQGTEFRIICDRNV